MTAWQFAQSVDSDSRSQTALKTSIREASSLVLDTSPPPPPPLFPWSVLTSDLLLAKGYSCWYNNKRMGLCCSECETITISWSVTYPTGRNVFALLNLSYLPQRSEKKGKKVLNIKGQVLCLEQRGISECCDCALQSSEHPLLLTDVLFTFPDFRH